MTKQVLAVLAACMLSSVAQADGFTLASWNIQTLTIPGEKVFNTQTADELRTAADMGELRAFRDALGADVVVLEEISSPKALAQVFPVGEWDFCLSGQYLADEKGLDPEYPADQLGAFRPLCYSAGATDLPDPPLGELRRQYLAIAVRRASGVSIKSVADLSELSVPFEDKDDDATVVVRNVRWGLDAVVEKNGKKLRLLGVHLKTGCFVGALIRNRWDDPPFQWTHDGTVDHPCMTLARQMRPLRSWVAMAAQDEAPFAIVGDFNRRIDVEIADTNEPDLFPVLSGEVTDATTDDVSLSHVPEGASSIHACWPEDDGSPFANAIDYMIFGPGARPSDWEVTYKKLRYVDVAAIGGSSLTQADNDWRLSDHCPIRITFQ